jgi:hypothetical protein
LITASTMTWMGLLSVSRWMISQELRTISTALIFLPLLRPCIISDAVRLRATCGVCLSVYSSAWAAACYQACAAGNCVPRPAAASYVLSLYGRRPAQNEPTSDSPLHDGALRLAEALLLVAPRCVRHIHGKLGLHRDVVLQRDVRHLRGVTSPRQWLHTSRHRGLQPNSSAALASSIMCRRHPLAPQPEGTRGSSRCLEDVYSALMAFTCQEWAPDAFLRRPTSTSSKVHLPKSLTSLATAMLGDGCLHVSTSCRHRPRALQKEAAQAAAGGHVRLAGLNEMLGGTFAAVMLHMHVAAWCILSFLKGQLCSSISAAWYEHALWTCALQTHLHQNLITSIWALLSKRSASFIFAHRWPILQLSPA